MDSTPASRFSQNWSTLAAPGNRPAMPTMATSGQAPSPKSGFIARPLARRSAAAHQMRHFVRPSPFSPLSSVRGLLVLAANLDSRIQGIRQTLDRGFREEINPRNLHTEDPPQLNDNLHSLQGGASDLEEVIIDSNPVDP